MAPNNATDTVERLKCDFKHFSLELGKLTNGHFAPRPHDKRISKSRPTSTNIKWAQRASVTFAEPDPISVAPHPTYPPSIHSQSSRLSTSHNADTPSPGDDLEAGHTAPDINWYAPDPPSLDHQQAKRDKRKSTSALSMISVAHKQVYPPLKDYKLVVAPRRIDPNTPFRPNHRFCHFPIRHGHEAALAIHPLERAFAPRKKGPSIFERTGFAALEALFVIFLVGMTFGWLAITAFLFAYPMIHSEGDCGWFCPKKVNVSP